MNLYEYFLLIHFAGSSTSVNVFISNYVYQSVI